MWTFTMEDSLNMLLFVKQYTHYLHVCFLNRILTWLYTYVNKSWYKVGEKRLDWKPWTYSKTFWGYFYKCVFVGGHLLSQPIQYIIGICWRKTRKKRGHTMNSTFFAQFHKGQHLELQNKYKEGKRN